MARTLSLLLSLTIATLGAQAQSQNQLKTQVPLAAQTQPAPIFRGNASQVTTTEPMRGVWLRSDQTGATHVVSTTANATEIRVEHGRANVQVYHPAEHAQITIDMPGGKVDLLKDGFYTFNADTNTVRVLHGEAASYPGGATDVKPLKIKEDHEYAFNGKPSEVPYEEIASDVLPGGGPGNHGDGRGGAYSYGPYGDGFYGGYPYGPYPYEAYGWGYPYGYGYPFGLGLGFGYYGGGFYGGGFRGGYGGFHGGGFGGGHGGHR